MHGCLKCRHDITARPLAQQDAIALSCFRAITCADAGNPPTAIQDWDRAVETLEIHGLLPCLGITGAGAAMPEAVRQKVLRNKLRLALYHTNAQDAMTGIAREMDAAGIPYALLKGTYLYELLYRGLFPRAYGDLDLLVPANRIADAIAALANAGYGRDTGDAHHAGLPRWHFHATLVSDRPGGLPLELHRALVDKANLYRLPEAELFERLTKFKTPRGEFTVLCAEDQFVYLCLHAAKHGILNSTALRGGFPAEWFCSPASGNRLIWFLDIDLFLRRQIDDLQWAVISERAQRWNVVADVRDCLRVLRLLQPASPADTAIRRLDRHLPDATTADMEQTGQRTVGARLLASGPVRRLLERAMRTDSEACVRPVRGMLLARTVVPSPARLLQYYGKTHRLWTPWLYIWHPLHMLRKLLAPDYRLQTFSG